MNKEARMFATNSPTISFPANSFDQMPHVRAERVREDYEAIISRWLRDRGWKYSSDNPGALWLWEKSVDGALIKANAGVAEWIQREADCNDYFRQHPEEMGD